MTNSSVSLTSLCAAKSFSRDFLLQPLALSIGDLFSHDGNFALPLEALGKVASRKFEKKIKG